MKMYWLSDKAEFNTLLIFSQVFSKNVIVNPPRKREKTDSDDIFKGAKNSSYTVKWLISVKNFAQW